MNPIIAQHLPELLALCKKYRVVSMYLFGSAARKDFDPERSDFDFLVSFDEALAPEERGENFFELMWALDELFGRQVDVITEKQLKNPYLIASINKDKQLIYEVAA
jgi:predicted nucleotidyltransferase